MGQRASSTSSPRRTGAETSHTRALLLDATAKVMRAEGYASVSSRRIAKEAGVTGALVHYYFPTLDDLFLELFRIGAERNLRHHEHVLAADRPLTELWEWSLDVSRAELLTEFMALSNQRPVIAGEIAAYSRRFRSMFIDALERLAGEGRIDLGGTPPDMVLLMIGSIARTLVVEHSVGLDGGHDDARRWMRAWLGAMERPARST